MRQYIGFKLGESEYTVPILRVREIVNTPAVTRLPQSPYHVRGIINLRGVILPVVDLKLLVEGVESSLDGSKVVVLTTGRATFGVLADAITSVVNIDEGDIEPPGEFMRESSGRIEGVVRMPDRLLILLDTDRIVAAEDLAALEGKPAASLPEAEEPPAPRPAPPSAMPVTETARAAPPTLNDARDALSRQLGDDEKKNNFIRNVVDLIETLASNDYDKADILIVEMLRTTGAETGLYREVGKVTRKLHDTLREFRSALDPRLRVIADSEIPDAVDRLQVVMDRTEDAANTTMEVIERHLAALPEAAAHLARLRGPRPSVAFIERHIDDLRADLNAVLVAQEVQDITGQSIKRVIDLVNAIEAELVGLISTFGVKLEEGEAERREPHPLSQDEIDSLLKEFGF
jgi:chemotaxis protein CheZ